MHIPTRMHSYMTLWALGLLLAQQTISAVEQPFWINQSISNITAVGGSNTRGTLRFLTSVPQLYQFLHKCFIITSLDKGPSF